MAEGAATGIYGQTSWWWASLPRPTGACQGEQASAEAAAHLAYAATHLAYAKSVNSMMAGWCRWVDRRRPMSALAGSSINVQECSHMQSSHYTRA